MKSVLVFASMVHLAASSCLNLKNLVNFGDSFSDENRLNYIYEHQGLPPAGTILPENSNTTTSGGYKWPRMVARKTGAKSFNYAVGGATCSNKIVEREFVLTPGKPFPSVLDEQVPAFKADLEFDELYGNRTADNTAYAVLIGGNDLIANGFLTDSNARGTNITSYISCVWDVFDALYETGGRHFIAITPPAAELSPAYLIPEDGGRLDNPAWLNKTAYNMTDYNYKLMEYLTSAKTMLQYGVPFQLIVEKRWPGATFSFFDLHGLMTDMLKTPEKYIDAPVNITGHYRHCDIGEFLNCPAEKEARESFFWFDELHVSERVEEKVADEFIKLLAQESEYGKTYRSWA
ncbi:hypothetical protein LCI18_002136 [Fusarium solani-melongenae]|uniref:Uncharacterized protein n=1 Tax=Fusarium solani subsp. cucurbitae TaxID=2747967 RepID=A0ACD3YQP2_FUSSC|nr:hypothetical protein LCI18_002136 [Fusarium solani-melongenae]